MWLFQYYFESYDARGALKPKVKEEALARARKGLDLSKKAKTRMAVAEYLVAKHIYDKASDEISRAIDYMHDKTQRGGS